MIWNSISPLFKLLTFGYCLLISDISFSLERLILLGGSDVIPAAASKQFLSWTQDQQAKPGPILIISWASTSYEYSQVIANQLRTSNPEIQIEDAPQFPITIKKKNIFLQQLKKATGVYFTGGDQARILQVIQDKDIRNALTSQFHSGVPFVGSSAGTAIMSHLAIIGEIDALPSTEPSIILEHGLGFLDSRYIVDMHFSERNRQARLTSILTKHSSHHGIGIDEPAGIILENGHGVVVGPGRVFIYKNSNVPTRILGHGDTFDL